MGFQRARSADGAQTGTSVSYGHPQAESDIFQQAQVAVHNATMHADLRGRELGFSNDQGQQTVPKYYHPQAEGDIFQQAQVAVHNVTVDTICFTTLQAIQQLCRSPGLHASLGPGGWSTAIWPISRSEKVAGKGGERLHSAKLLLRHRSAADTRLKTNERTSQSSHSAARSKQHSSDTVHRSNATSFAPMGANRWSRSALVRA